MDFGFNKKNPLPAVLIATFTSGFAFGVVLPIASVILEERQVPTPLIGLTATIVFVGWALGSPLAGRMIELYGVQRTLAGGILMTGLAMIAHGLSGSLPFWFALRFFIGVASASIFTACEILINRISTDSNRGKNLGLYGFAFSLSLMIGPLGLWLLRYGQWAPFSAAGVFCCCIACFVYGVLPRAHEPAAPAGAIDFHFVRRIRVSLTAMLMAGFMEGALIALIPVYTLRQGFSEAQTGILLFSFMLGHGCLTPLMGMLGDRIGLRQGLMLTYALGSASFILLVFFPTHMAIAGALLCAGASVGALYPLAVGLLAGALAPAELPRGNALTTFCYGIGSIAGPFVPSLIMHVTIPKSLFAVTAALYVIVLLGMRLPKKKMPCVLLAGAALFLQTAGPAHAASGTGNRDTCAALYSCTQAGVDTLLSRLVEQTPDFNGRIRKLAALYVGAPYAAESPLHDEAADWLPYAQTDCTLFVLYITAFANSRSLQEARGHMRRLHYRGGVVGFKTRYHFTEDRITDPANRYFSVVTEQYVKTPRDLRQISLVLNRKKDGGYLFGDRLDTWSKKVTLHYIPRKGFVPAMLNPLPAAVGIAFVKKSNWEKGVIVGHEGLLIDGNLYHASPGKGVQAVGNYLEQAFPGSPWEGFVLFSINAVAVRGHE